MEEANKKLDTLAKLPEDQKEKYNLHLEESERVGGVIDRVATRVENVLEDKYVKEGIYKVIDIVDENYMDTVRKVWDKTPDEVKWAIIEQGHIFKGLPFVYTIQLLVKSGLLEYNEQAVHDMAENEKKVLEWATKYGPVIQPELLFLKPLVEPIKRVMEIHDKAFLEMRVHLKEKQIDNKRLLAKKNNSQPLVPKTRPAKKSEKDFEPTRWSV